MIRLAITGVSGYIGQAFLRHLKDDPTIDAIGIDVRPSALPLRGFYKWDIRQPLVPILKENSITTLLHLAFVFNPTHSSQTEYQVNVEGTRKVLEACKEAGLRKVIIPSSTTVYGAYPDNRPLLSEDSPLRANSTFTYSRDKARVEALCQQFMEENPRILLSILRFCIVLGAKTNNFISCFMDLPVMLCPKGHNPAFQFIHEEDAVELLLLVIKKDFPGVFNVTADGTLLITEMAGLYGKRLVRVSPRLLSLFLTLCWGLDYLLERLDSSTRFPFPPGLLNFMRYQWTVSNQRMKEEIGFIPRHTTEEAFEEYVRAKKVSSPNLFKKRLRE